jgi:hypothetical protein
MWNRHMKHANQRLSGLAARFQDSLFERPDGGRQA